MRLTPAPAGFVLTSGVGSSTHARNRREPYDNGTHTCARRGLDVRAVPDESGAAVEANARSSLTDSVRCRGDHGDHDAGCCICCQNTAAPLGCMLLGRGRRTVPLRSLHGSTSPIKLEGEVAPGRASVSLAFGSSTHKRAWHRPFRRGERERERDGTPGPPCGARTISSVFVPRLLGPPLLKRCHQGVGWFSAAKCFCGWSL